MNGFYIAIGQQGTGKTAFITKHIVDNWSIDNKRKIFSNYTLYNVPHTPITFDNDKEVQKGKLDILKTLSEDENFFNNSIMAIDEIHVYFSSSSWLSKNVRPIQTFFSQLRKRNILLLATSQFIIRVDPIIRQQAKFVFDMENTEGSVFKVNTSKIDGYYTKYVSTNYFDLKKYFDYYDTNEIIH